MTASAHPIVGRSLAAASRSRADWWKERRCLLRLAGATAEHCRSWKRCSRWNLLRLFLVLLVLVPLSDSAAQSAVVAIQVLGRERRATHVPLKLVLARAMARSVTACWLDVPGRLLQRSAVLTGRSVLWVRRPDGSCDATEQGCALVSCFSIWLVRREMLIEMVRESWALIEPVQLPNETVPWEERSVTDGRARSLQTREDYEGPVRAPIH